MLHAHLKEIANPDQGASNDLVSNAPDNTENQDNFDQNYIGINNNNDQEVNGQAINDQAQAINEIDNDQVIYGQAISNNNDQFFNTQDLYFQAISGQLI